MKTYLPSVSFVDLRESLFSFIKVEPRTLNLPFHKLFPPIARTRVMADVSKNDPEIRKLGQFISPELAIKNIPYIYEAVKSQAQKMDAFRRTESDLLYIEDSYERCRLFCAERDQMLELGLRLLPKSLQRAGWAINAWGRRIDDLVNSPEADHIRSRFVDEWELRTQDIFNGRPHDILDAALVDTISKFDLDIKPFQDLLKGMRMNTAKNRYANLDELLLYCYYVAGTGGPMIIPIIGISPDSTMPTETIYHGVVQLFIAGTVYLPQDELAQFGLCDEDIFSRKVTDEWRAFMNTTRQL